MPDPTPIVLTRSADVEELARALRGVERFGFDLESDGLFAYRAKVCTIQIAWEDHVAVVDALATSLAPLAEVLSDEGPIKIVHDVAFDARLLAEAGIVLGNVHDTSIAARLLGRSATGLATLVAADLGLTVSKALQQHDWRLRPLAPEMLAYLAGDVVHLASLDDSLFAEVRARGIEPEVLEETRYRLTSAVQAATSPDDRPAYVRLKGVDRVHGRELAMVRRLADVREREATRRDAPPQRVLPAEAIFAIARARPGTFAQLRRLHGALRVLGESDPFARELLAAVAQGLADGAIPEADRRFFERPTLSVEELKARRAREGRLTAWRRAEAKRRGVDEQVVLPGHCLKDIAAAGPTTLEELARIPGLGLFRVERDGLAILDAANATEASVEPAVHEEIP